MVLGNALQCVTLLRMHVSNAMLSRNGM